ncbi:MAG: DUF2087 domain-containing protein [Actinobacteria bacterium]|nr:MAG: DUF2087 domain-containing protein [Actinomycetota bacterium]
MCGLLAEEERLRVYAAVVLGAGTPSEVAAGSGLPAREVVSALRRLEQGGLVSMVDGRLVADTGAFKDAVREFSPDPAEEPLDPDRQRAAVLRAFVRDGRLVQLPSARSKRRVVLEHIAACFEPGVRYPERAVDAVLRAWYDDYVTLRRYLIDEDLLARDHGLYWRAGGYVDVS